VASVSRSVPSIGGYASLAPGIIRLYSSLRSSIHSFIISRLDPLGSFAGSDSSSPSCPKPALPPALSTSLFRFSIRSWGKRVDSKSRSRL